MLFNVTLRIQDDPFSEIFGVYHTFIPCFQSWALFLEVNKSSPLY